MKYLASTYCTEHSNVEGHNFVESIFSNKQSTIVLYKMDINVVHSYYVIFNCVYSCHNYKKYCTRLY